MRLRLVDGPTTVPLDDPESTAWSALADTAAWALTIPGLSVEARADLEEMVGACHRAAGLVGGVMADGSRTNDEAPPCDGSPVCLCPDCEGERAEAVRRGVRPRKPQPWQDRRKEKS